MPKWYDYLKRASRTITGPVDQIGSAIYNNGSKFLYGTPGERENVSLLRPEQEQGYQQLQNAAQGRGAGGAYGTTADYYRDLMSDDSQDYQAFSRPMMREYNEDIVPGLSEQFAGMGSGGLSSSGFRNAQLQGATDLSERLGALRANLRQRGAEGLMNIGNQSLQSYSQNMETKPGSSGFLQQAAPLAAHGALAYATGGSSLPYSAASMSGAGKPAPPASTTPQRRNTSPYGNPSTGYQNPPAGYGYGNYGNYGNSGRY